MRRPFYVSLECVAFGVLLRLVIYHTLLCVSKYLTYTQYNYCNVPEMLLYM